MVSLLDLAPAKKTVTLTEGVTIDVRGLSVTDITTLLRQYPELRKLFGGRGGAGNFNISELIDKFPDAMAHVIALGTGKGTPEEIDVARTLSMGYAIPILVAIIEETLGGDLDGPFVTKLLSLADQVEQHIDAGGKARPTKSPRASKS